MTSNMSAEVRKVFKAAGVDVGRITFIPREAVHAFMVRVDAWLDAEQRLLMFVTADRAAVAQFMYYIGEERNVNVVGIGRGIAAWAISDARVEWLQSRLAAYDKNWHTGEA